MSAPVYRIASVWRAVKDARRVGRPVVALACPEELAAAMATAMRSVSVCECDEMVVPHIHVNKEQGQ